MTTEERIKVTYFQRQPTATQYSLERVFDAVRHELPPEFDPRVGVCRYGNGGWKRVYNLVEALCRQGDINHITGDVHYLAYLLSRKRTVLTIHDCGGMQQLQGWRRWLFRWLWLSLPVRRSAVVTAISEQTKAEIIRYTGCSEEAITIVPDPVGAEFVPTPKSFNAAKPVILHIGTAAHKNLARTALALRGIVCQLHIIGPLRDEDRRRLGELGVEYVSSERLTDEEVLQAYRDADMLLFPSTYEGFGLPIIEANAVGRVVVTSDIAPMCHVAGGAACLVDPYAPDSIRSGVSRVLRDPQYRERLIRAGYENARRFSAAAVAAQYSELYRVLLKQAG